MKLYKNTYAERKAIKLENLKNYIEQLEFENKAYKVEHNHNITKIDKLESDKQKLIEKLELEIEADEEDLKYNNLSDYGKGCLDETKEILEIVKGEKHE